MTLTRRRFLAGVGGTAGAALLAPIVGPAHRAFGAALVDPATAIRNRLVVIFLQGGNDGLNTVIPRGDVAGAARHSIYRKVRPSISYAAGDTLALDAYSDSAHALGLNRALPTVHALYRSGRVAIVQGVDYPSHSYSHFTSTDIWQSGELPTPASGWIGRHLDRAGIGEGELRAVAVGTDLPLILRGRHTPGTAIRSIAATEFSDAAVKGAGSRHATLARFSDYPRAEPVRHAAGRIAAQTVDVVSVLRGARSPAEQPVAVVDGLLTARTLLEQPLGVETIFVRQPGYDTHVAETRTHEPLLGDLDGALEAFFLGSFRGRALGPGPLAPSVAARTLVLVVSEFGRRIGENGAAAAGGTDHGAAAPVFLIGPPPDAAARVALVPGLHGDHPAMGTVALPADNLTMTTDVRRVFQSILQGWLASPDPMFESLGALPNLILTGANAGAKAATLAGGRAPKRVTAPGPTSGAPDPAAGADLAGAAAVAGESPEFGVALPERRAAAGGDGPSVPLTAAALGLTIGAGALAAHRVREEAREEA